MKLLLSQEEHIKFTRPFDALERNYYKFLSKHEIIPCPNIIKVPDNEYDCLLLTGGPDSIARHQTEDLLYKHAFENKKPIIGICHGAFVINDLNGGTHGRVDGHVDADITITMEGQEHVVRCFHSQSIETLAKDFVAIAHDKQGNIEAFRHNKLPIYGVVWHPERMEMPVLPEDVKKLLD